MSDDDFKYRVSFKPMPLTGDDASRKVISKWHKTAATGAVEIEDKILSFIVREKPKRMKQENWLKLLKKVLRVEVLDSHIIGVPSDD